MSTKKAPLHSMTGFGRSKDDWEGMQFVAELSSVNSKFLDLSFHGPPGMAELEVEVRRLLGRSLHRGKVRCSLRVQSGEGGGAALSLREGNLREYLRLYAEIKQTYGLEGTLTAEALLFAPEIVAPAEFDTGDEGFQEWIEGLLNRALGEMLRMRAEEGAWLKGDLEARIDRLEELTGRIGGLAPRAREAFRRRLLDRLAEIREEVTFAEDRIAAEVAFMAEKADVSEELARLASHVSQFRESLTTGGPVGRRLDFLSQELNREVNTIGAKTGDAEIGTLVIDFKEELAKVREQVQNIE